MSREKLKKSGLKNDEIKYVSYNDLKEASDRILAKNKDLYNALKEL